MMSFVPLFLVSILLSATQAEQITKCELSQRLKDLAGYRGITLPEWICVIFHISGWDTQTVVSNDGNTEYGLFQISDKLWCASSQNPQSKNICDISCDMSAKPSASLPWLDSTKAERLEVAARLLDDDFTDDIKCVKKILDIKGIDYWLAHKPLCSDKLEQWLCKTS